MSLLNPIEELVNYIISHIHEGLLLNKLDSQQLKANISEGIYILQDVQFNSKSINQNLPYSSFHISSAKASKMNLNLPSLLKIFEQPVKIRLTDLEVNLCSAKSSGFSVSIPNVEPLSLSDENAGINLLTKSIGKFLSNFNIEICFLTVNIIGEDGSIQITVPKLVYNENIGTKVFRIEGIWITVDNDLNNKVCAIENDIEGYIAIGKNGIEISSNIDKLMLYINYRQIESVCRIIKGLGVSELFESSSPELIKVLREIDLKIGMDTAIKTTKCKFEVNCVDVIVMKEPTDLECIWDYNKNIHNDLQKDHFHLRASKFKYEVNKQSTLMFSDVYLDYYHYCEKSLTNSSGLFQSAQDEFFSEFFKLPTHFNGLSENICVKRVVKFDKKNEECAIRINDTEAFLSPVKFSFNKTIADDLVELYNRVYKIFESSNNGKSEGKDHKTIENFLFICSGLCVEYSVESSQCWSQKASLSINLALNEVTAQFDNKTEVTINSILAQIEVDTAKYSLLEVKTIIFEYSYRNSLEAEAIKTKNYYSYFDPSQGFILLSKNNSYQPTEKYISIPVDEPEHLNRPPEGNLFIANLSVTLIITNVSLDTYGYLKSIQLPISPLLSTHTNTQPRPTKYFISVRSLRSTFHTIDLHCENLNLKLNTSEAICALTNFKLSSPNSESYSSKENCILLTYTPSNINVNLTGIIIHYSLIQDLLEFSNIFTSHSEEDKGTDTFLPLKICIENSFVVIPFESYFLSVFLTDFEILSIFGNFNCGKFFIGSSYVLLSGFKYENNIEMTLQNLLYLNSFILMTVTCASFRVIQTAAVPSEICGADGKCIRFFDDFFICEHAEITQSCFNATIAIGSCILHLCKDTISLLSDIIRYFPKMSSSEIEDLGDKSIYYDFEPKFSNKIIHFHSSLNSIEQQPSSFAFFISFNLSSLFVNCYSGYEFPQEGQPKKNLLNRLMLKSSEISINYSSDFGNKWTGQCEISSFEVLNYLSNSNIKKIICRDVKNTEYIGKSFELKVNGSSQSEKYGEIDVFIQVCPIKINLDEFFIQFCAEWSKSQEDAENPEILEEINSSQGCFVKGLTINPVSLSIDYIQNNTKIVSLFKIEDFLVVLPKVEGKNYKNIDIAIDETWSSWLSYLEGQKFIALLGSLTPVVSISNITFAIINVLKTPFESENTSESVKRGIISLLKVFSLESIKVFDSCFAVILLIGNKFRVLKQSRVNFPKNIAQAVNLIQPDKKLILENLNKYKRQN